MTPEQLDCIALTVPADALDHFEAALGSVCRAVSFFHDEDRDIWDIQGVKERGAYEAELASALMVAEMLTGHTPEITRSLVPVGGLAGADQGGVSRAVDRRAFRGARHAYFGAAQFRGGSR